MFGGGRKGGRGNFIHSKNSFKHKIQLFPSKVCATLYLFKERVANPHPLKKFSQNIIKLKKKI